MTKEQLIEEIRKRLDPEYMGTFKVWREVLHDALKYLQEPTLPAVPTEKHLQCLWGQGNDPNYSPSVAARRYQMLYESLTTPKTKKVWCVAFTMKRDNSHHIIMRTTKEQIDKERAACVGPIVGSTYKNVSPVWEQEVPFDTVVQDL